MFSLIVLTAALIIIVVLTFIESDGRVLLLTTTATIFVSLFCMGVASFGDILPADEICTIEEIDIFALNDDVGANGSSFLGTGHANSSLYYYYITVNDDGSKEIHQLDSGSVKVFDNVNDAPHITIISKRNSNPLLRFFFFTEREEIEIHIPPNSITNDYNVDLN